MKYKFRRFKLHRLQIPFGILWLLIATGSALISIEAAVLLGLASLIMIPIILSDNDVYIKESIKQ